MKDRIQDEFRQKTPVEPQEKDSAEGMDFITQLAWGATILLVIGLLDVIFS